MVRILRAIRVLGAVQSVRVLDMNRQSNEERLAGLEAHQEHAATKADLAQLEARMVERMGKGETKLIQWIVAMMFAAVVAGGAIVAVVEKLL